MIGTPILTMEATVVNYDETAISPGIIVVWNCKFSLVHNDEALYIYKLH
jgi:hypothetical protein